MRTMSKSGIGLIVALLWIGNVEAANLLVNAGFETGNLNSWHTNWLPDQSGALVTTTAAHSSTYGLWIYTADGYSGSAFASVDQVFTASAGDVFKGSAYIRTPVPGRWVDWVEGSYACVRLQFLTASGGTLISYDSPYLTTANTPYGDPFQIITPPAPDGTGRVRFLCYLYEPAGDSRQSVANFDDCSLEKLEVPNPVLSIDPPALGFGFDLDVLTFDIKNTGTGTLTWNVAADSDWINVAPDNGDTTTETDTITVTVDRSGLTRPRYQGVITVTSDGGDDVVDVYMETELTYTVPRQPSIVTTDGSQLKVQLRKTDGTLSSSRLFTIKGTAWAPARIGTTSSYASRRNAFGDWYRLDIQMLKQMRADTIYTFIDFGTDPALLETGLEILDYCYHNNIMVIMTVDEDGTDNTANITQVVEAYKNHPAVLMWAIGNEWNLWRPDRPYYYFHYETLAAAAEAMQSNVEITKDLDSNHAVCSILGEINYPTQADVNNIVNNVCTDVDVWGANIYRGPEFYALFTEWGGMSGKPLFLSEFGTDAFHTTSWWPPVGYEDENMQAAFEQTLWADLAADLSAHDPAHVCLGGTVFEWSDEWWKSSTGDPNVHEPDGYETTWNPIAHPDGFANEEWFGIVTIERRRREAYFTLAAEYQKYLGDIDGDGDVDIVDLAELLGHYGACIGDPRYDYRADFDDDGCIRLPDLAELLAHYGTGT